MVTYAAAPVAAPGSGMPEDEATADAASHRARKRRRKKEPAWHRRERRLRSTGRLISQVMRIAEKLASHHGSAPSAALMRLCTSLKPPAEREWRQDHNPDTHSGGTSAPAQPPGDMAEEATSGGHPAMPSVALVAPLRECSTSGPPEEDGRNEVEDKDKENDAGDVKQESEEEDTRRKEGEEEEGDSDATEITSTCSTELEHRCATLQEDVNQLLAGMVDKEFDEMAILVPKPHRATFHKVLDEYRDTAMQVGKMTQAIEALRERLEQSRAPGSESEDRGSDDGNG